MVKGGKTKEIVDLKSLTKAVINNTVDLLGSKSGSESVGYGWRWSCGLKLDVQSADYVSLWKHSVKINYHGQYPSLSATTQAESSVGTFQELPLNRRSKWLLISDRSCSIIGSYSAIGCRHRSGVSFVSSEVEHCWKRVDQERWFWHINIDLISSMNA